LVLNILALVVVSALTTSRRAAVAAE
jgi:hypothetical protein